MESVAALDLPSVADKALAALAASQHGVMLSIWGESSLLVSQ